MAEGRFLSGRGQGEWLKRVERASEFLTLMDGDLRLLYVNHLQPGVDEYQGVSVFDFVEPSHHDELRAATASARRTNMPQHFENAATGPNGKSSFYSNWVMYLADEGEDMYVFISTDITHVRRVENALELSETTFRSLVDNAPDFIFLADPQRRIVYANRAAFGRTTEQLTGTRVEDLVREEDRAAVIEAFELSLETLETQAFEATVETDAGARFVATRLGPIVQDGHVHRIALVSTDVTRRRRSEEERERLAAQLFQAQKMEALGQLTGGIAHDFNNLLTTIAGNLDLIRFEAEENRGIEKLVSHALEAVHSAGQLVRSLLAFARAQALRPQVVDVNALLADMQVLLSRALGETIEVELAGSDGLWSCEVDPHQLQSAILNLAINAGQAMPNGGRLRIATANMSRGSFVRIRVRDEGVGMTQDVVAQACEPFFTTRNVGHGSGLGLSMVHGFVHQSGGEMSIDSEPGHGTTVELLLPRSARVAKPAVPPATSPQSATGNGELVLVVDDAPPIRAVTTQLLRSLRYRTAEAEDAASALEALAQTPETVVLLSDVVLPGGTNGLQLMREAQRRHPHLHIVLASGYAAESISALGDLPPDIEFLHKPFAVTELADALHRTLQAPSVR